VGIAKRVRAQTVANAGLEAKYRSALGGLGRQTK